MVEFILALIFWSFFLSSKVIFVEQISSMIGSSFYVKVTSNTSTLFLTQSRIRPNDYWLALTRMVKVSKSLQVASSLFRNRSRANLQIQYATKSTVIT